VLILPCTMLIMVQQMFESRNDIYSLSSTPHACTHVPTHMHTYTHTHTHTYTKRRGKNVVSGYVANMQT